MTAPDIDQSQYSMTTHNHNFYKQFASIMTNLSLKYLQVSIYYIMNLSRQQDKGRKVANIG